jgi:hypothetical protein
MRHPSPFFHWYFLLYWLPHQFVLCFYMTPCSLSWFAFSLCILSPSSCISESRGSPSWPLYSPKSDIFHLFFPMMFSVVRLNALVVLYWYCWYRSLSCVILPHVPSVGAPFLLLHYPPTLAPQSCVGYHPGPSIIPPLASYAATTLLWDVKFIAHIRDRKGHSVSPLANGCTW